MKEEYGQSKDAGHIKLTQREKFGMCQPLPALDRNVTFRTPGEMLR